MIRWDDLLRIGVNNLVKRKLRTFLTLLGVIIGTASIVVMISLGNGMEQSFKAEIERMGSLTNIDVHKSWGGSRNGGNTQDKKLNEKTVASIDKIEHVKALLPIKENHMRVVLGRKVASLNVMGTDASRLSEFGYEILKGKELNNTSKSTIVFGFKVHQDFYDPRSRGGNDYYWEEDEETLGPDGEPVYNPKVDLITKNIILTQDWDYPENRHRNNDMKKPEKFKFNGVGVLRSTQTYDDYQAFVSLKTMKQMIKDDAKAMDDRNALKTIDEYDKIVVKVDDISNVEDVQKQIKQMGYEASSLMDIITSMKKTTQVVRLVLAGIGSVSLVVAAIGIANTMIMSIYERTSEIGVLKVIGADLKDIRNIFLIESGLIGLIGGLFGIAISFGISGIINFFASNFAQGHQISVIDFKLASLGVVFASLIGIISGYSPARRAMKLSVLRALRNNA